MRRTSRLLALSEVNARDVGNRLNGRLRVIVLQGNRGLLDDIEELWKLGAQVGILRAAVAEVPTGIHRERLQVGEPSAAESSGCFRRRKSLELGEVDGLRAFGRQVGV